MSIPRVPASPGPSGNGDVPLQGGVLLGSRKLTLHINRQQLAKLEALAAANATGIHEAASFLLARVIDNGYAQLQASKFIYECSNWVMWPYAKVG